MLIVDTNIIIDVLEDDPKWAQWSIDQLTAQSQVHELVINPIIYSELSLTFKEVEALDSTLEDMGLVLKNIPRPALFLAGKAFIKYKRAGGGKTNELSDFYIGAHAAVMGCDILTRDDGRYLSYFPSVALLTPG